MLKAIIIEDENLIAKELQYKISEVAADVEILHVLPSLKTAFKWFLENAEPDIIFADIQLSDGISFEIFKRYDLKCPVIFTTAYDEYAIQAFKVNGIDYLLKPVDTEDLKKAIDKSRVIIESKSDYPKELQHLLDLVSSPTANKMKFKEKFIVSHRKKWIPIRVADIACFYKDSLNYIHTFSGEKYMLDFTTLEEVEELLDPAVFYRSNRQSIININAIESIKPLENQKLIVTLKPPLVLDIDVSREKAPTFKKWLDS